MLEIVKFIVRKIRILKVVSSYDMKTVQIFVKMFANILRAFTMENFTRWDMIYGMKNMGHGMKTCK